MEERLCIEIQQEKQYLNAQVSGKLSLENCQELIDIVASESKKRGCGLFLVDMLKTGPPATEMDRFYLGKYAASKFRQGPKVAFVYPQELINKFFENTAVNRGAIMLVVGNREEALTWLLEDLPSKADAGDA